MATRFGYARGRCVGGDRRRRDQHHRGRTRRTIGIVRVADLPSRLLRYQSKSHPQMVRHEHMRESSEESALQCEPAQEHRRLTAIDILTWGRTIDGQAHRSGQRPATCRRRHTREFAHRWHRGEVARARSLSARSAKPVRPRRGRDRAIARYRCRGRGRAPRVCHRLGHGNRSASRVREPTEDIAPQPRHRMPERRGTRTESRW